MSPEMRLVLAPRETYAALVRTSSAISPLMALRRPLLVAAAVGVSVAIAATGRASPALVLSTTVTWSYLVVLQLAIALPFVAPAARRSMGLARALDLFFASHAPWSLFVLAVAAWSSTGFAGSVWPPLLAAIVPIALTARIVYAFFIEVMGTDRHAAARLTFLHQAITGAIFIAINFVASAIWPRVLALLGRP